MKAVKKEVKKAIVGVSSPARAGSTIFTCFKTTLFIDSIADFS